MNLRDEINILQNHLHVGQARAIHKKELSKLTGISEDKIKRMVRRARIAGIQIMSGHDGYYIAECDQDFERFKRMMTKQATSRFNVLRGVERGRK